VANWISFNLHTTKAKRGKIRGRRKLCCVLWEGSYQTCQKDYCNEQTSCHDPTYTNRADYEGVRERGSGANYFRFACLGFFF